MTTQRRTLFLSSRHSRMKAKVPCSRGKLSRVDAAATPDDYSIKLPVTEAENWSALTPSAVATKKFRWLSRSRPSSLATPGSRSFRARQWGLLQRTPTSRQCRASRKGVLKADYTAVLEVLTWTRRRAMLTRDRRVGFSGAVDEGVRQTWPLRRRRPEPDQAGKRVDVFSRKRTPH